MRLTKINNMYYTYMIRCRDGTLYTGITTDPVRRLREHSSAGARAAKYTRTHKAAELAALWSSRDRSSASRLEYCLKSLSKSRKEQLCLDGDLSVLKGRICCEDYTYVPAISVITPEDNGR